MTLKIVADSDPREELDALRIVARALFGDRLKMAVAHDREAARALVFTIDLTEQAGPGGAASVGEHGESSSAPTSKSLEGARAAAVLSVISDVAKSGAPSFSDSSTGDAVPQAGSECLAGGGIAASPDSPAGSGDRGQDLQSSGESGSTPLASSTSTAQRPAWTPIQRAAAHALFHTLDDADTTNGCPVELVCAKLAEVAGLFLMDKREDTKPSSAPPHFAFKPLSMMESAPPAAPDGREPTKHELLRIVSAVMLTTGQMADAVIALYAPLIAKLRAERDAWQGQAKAAQKQRDGLQSDLSACYSAKSQAIRNGDAARSALADAQKQLATSEARNQWPACGCVLDSLHDVCMTHSPAVARVTAERDEWREAHALATRRAGQALADLAAAQRDRDAHGAVTAEDVDKSLCFYDDGTVRLEQTARALTARLPATAMGEEVDIVFDGPPGPESGRFVEVEDMNGKSVRFGAWIDRLDGTWALRVARLPAQAVRLVLPEREKLAKAMFDAANKAHGQPAWATAHRNTHDVYRIEADAALAEVRRVNESEVK